MSQRTLDNDRSVAGAAERQMRRWAMRMETQARVDQEHAEEHLPPPVHPFLAISRESGAGGGEIARRVAAQLGWDVMDRELLSHMAESFDLPQGMLELVDEARSTWLLEIFGKWLDRSVVTQSEYVTRLGQTVLMAAHHASTVFVGRGAQFILPGDHGLRVQFVAPLDDRITRVATRRGLDREAARRLVVETDAARADFVLRYFHRDVTDPHLYDLVINLEHHSLDDAVELLVTECERRFAPLVRPNRPR